MGGQTFVFFFFFRGLRGLDCSFRTLAKNCCNYLMCGLIALKFGTNREHIKVDSGTEFGMNLVTIQYVRSNDLCRKWLNFKHAYRVKC